MKRRSFLKNSALATGATTVTIGSGMAMTPKKKKKKKKANFKLKYAPHFGMFKNSAGEDFIDQINFMAERGFTAFEDNGMMKRDVETQTKIGEALVKNNMTMGVFVIDKGGNMANTLAAGDPKNVEIFLDGCKRAVEER